METLKKKVRTVLKATIGFMWLAIGCVPLALYTHIFIISLTGLLCYALFTLLSSYYIIVLCDSYAKKQGINKQLIRKEINDYMKSLFNV